MHNLYIHYFIYFNFKPILIKKIDHFYSKVGKTNPVKKFGVMFDINLKVALDGFETGGSAITLSYYSKLWITLVVAPVSRISLVLYVCSAMVCW